MGEIQAVRRVFAVLVVLVILAWVLLPVARGYSLVSANHSEPSVPTDLGVADVTFESTDGTPIHAWLAPAKVGAPAVVLIHGFKTSRAEMLPWARFLHDAGYNALLLDLRGAGRSGGGTIGLGATEPRDIVAAVQTAGEAFRTDRVAVLGISLGAGAAILAAADDPRIAAVVADSAWTDQDFQLARLGYIDAGPFRLPLPPLGPVAVNAMVGADVTRARPLEAIAHIAPRPILLIHSADDDNATTPLEGARRLFAAAGQPKELWVAPHGGHVGAINAFPDEYRARVVAFFRQALG
ncbi:MAG TPA: alpha/beta fold hydrolase [Candidatus Bathyarchaeia archaeon]|nr:alpha/beta fold hydrolase [Candidatus Bathyarchaeia archaeon]